MLSFGGDNAPLQVNTSSQMRRHGAQYKHSENVNVDPEFTRDQ